MPAPPCLIRCDSRDDSKRSAGCQPPSPAPGLVKYGVRVMLSRMEPLPPSPSPLEVLAAEFAAGALRPETIADRATEIMIAGYESRALAVTAGLTKADVLEARTWLGKALVELDALPMSPERVARVLCDTWLRDIIFGRVPPLIGAQGIRLLAIDYDFEGPSELTNFGFLDEDDFIDGDPYESEIRELARRALTHGWAARADTGDESS